MDEGWIGLIGALLGAAVGGAAAWRVTKWQGEQQLLQKRLERLEDAVADLHTFCFELVALRPPGLNERLDMRRYPEFVRRCLIVQTRSLSLSPSLAEVMLEGALNPEFDVETVRAVLWKLNGWMRDAASSEQHARSLDAMKERISTWQADPSKPPPET